MKHNGDASSEPALLCGTNGAVLRKNTCAPCQEHSGEAAYCSKAAATDGGRRDGAPLASTPACTRFQQLLEGLDAPGDSGNPPEPPPWLDREMFDKGRRFYHRYLFCVFVSDLLALIMMFCVDRIVRPLIYTGRSNTPFKALRRYVSTIRRVILWYSGDVWRPGDPAHVDILQVRQIHKTSAGIFNSSEHHAKVDTATLGPWAGEEPTCPFSASERQDLREQVEGGVELEPRPALYLSQWDMMFSQYCFLGVMVAHPWRMGAWWVTNDELAGLIHFWRGVGWLLGIEDKYNFCNGTVEETRALCMEIERRVVKPCIAKAGKDHEIMGSSLADGVSSILPCFSYPAMLRLLADTLDLKMPSVSTSMTARHTFHYVFLRVVIHGLFLVPGVVWVFNEVLKFALCVVQGRHPRWQPKVKAAPYSYS